jgi:O-antigen ligase
MCLFFIENRRSLVEFRHTIVISVVGMISMGLSQYLFNPEGRMSGIRLGTISLLTDPNDLAAVTIMAFPLVCAPLFDSKSSILSRTASVVFSLVSVTAIWFTRSRGALLALLAELFCMHYLRDVPRRRTQAMLLAALLGVGYVALVHVLPRGAADLEVSEQSRVIYWETAADMLLHHPITGVGFDQYPHNYEFYGPRAKLEWGQRTAHSSWFLVFAESGLVGGFLFTAFLMAVCRVAWRLRGSFPDQLFALVGYSIAMSFLSHSYIMFPYLLYGLILASDSIEGDSLA